MKLIHTSDLHIDSPLTAHFDRRQVRERKAELASVLERIVTDGTELGVDGVIIAGDLFDTDEPSRSCTERVLYTIKKAKRLSFFYLTGNHERNAILRCGIALPENLYIFGEDWTYFTVGDVQLAGRSTTRENMFDTLRLTSQNSIVVLHGALGDKSDPFGTVGRREAGSCGAKYIALGHYHSYSCEALSPFCNAVYCGTPEGRGFDEAGKKGYVVIDIDNNKTSHKFVEIAKRTLHIIDVDVTGASKSYEVDDRIRAAISSIPSTDLVRVRLTGSRRVSLITDADGYTSRYSDSFYYFELTDSTHLEVDKELFLKDRTVIGEFVRHVMSKDGITDDEKNKIIECGLMAMGIEA